MSDTPYVSAGRAGIPTPDELRSRIPGWGADLDPADRPSVPQEIPSSVAEHLTWDHPGEQVEVVPRERSIEHAELPPVFGTPHPPRGVSGAIRRHAFRRYSEARTTHWLLLMAADRVDTCEGVLRDVAGRATRVWADHAPRKLRPR